MLQSLFKPRPARLAGEALYAAIAAQARDPAFYRALGVPDRIDARFELYALHLALLLERLSGEGEEAEEVGQAALDAYVASLDDVLREAGIGDLSMAKKMKAVASLLMGRLKAVRDALSPPDRAALAAFLSRTVYAEVPQADSGALADYVLRAHATLQTLALSELLRGRPAWPQVS
jgi:cytochrome b pre-mRNA-processing protein 3